MTPENPKPRVAALFATMNRHATAVQCVQALAKQTSPPAMVVVADNDSSDQTAEVLEALPDLPFPLHVIRMGYNSGNAGGVRAAMELAFGKNAEAAWILDDDSFPRETALHAMLDCYDPLLVNQPLQINPNTGRFTWPLTVRIPGQGKRLVWNEDAMGSQRVIEAFAAWTGALVSREIYEKTGPVNEDLFIRGEDEEYPWRIANCGFRFQLVRNAILDHVGPENLVHWRFGGKNLFLEKGLADWKLYYKVRNMVWLKRKQGGIFRALAIALAYVAGIVQIDGASRVKILLRAIFDGLRSKLGPLGDRSARSR